MYITADKAMPMAQAVTCLSINVKVFLRSQTSPFGICVDRVALVEVFLQVPQFSNVSVIPSIKHIHSVIHPSATDTI
jgi:hypothetical protein